MRIANPNMPRPPVATTPRPRPRPKPMGAPTLPIKKGTANLPQLTPKPKGPMSQYMRDGGMAMRKGYADGGMPMVMKDGKKVPSFAADGKGKMAMGGMATKNKGAAMKKGGMAPKGRGMAIMIAIGKPKGRGKS